MPSKVKVKKKSKPAYDPRLLDFSNGDPLMGEETGPMYSTLPPEQLPSRAEYDAAMQAHFAERHAAQDAFMQKLWALQDQAGVQLDGPGGQRAGRGQGSHHGLLSALRRRGRR